MKKKNLFIIVYGDAKTGKTLSAARAFPGGLFIALSGAVLSANYVGVEPKVLEVDENVGVKYITEVIKQKAGDFPAIIIDDLSIIMDNELAACKKKFKGWDAYDVFNNRMYALRDAARGADCHVIFTMHQQPPKEVGEEGSRRWIKGCPMVPGLQLPKKLPSHADLILRVVYDKKALGWPYLFQAGPDKDYVTGDRLAIVPEKFPMNLREAMLAAGYEVPRPKELAHLDEHVEALCQVLSPELAQKRPDVKRILREALPGLEKGLTDPHHIRWVFADALDRAYLRNHSNNMLDAYIQSL